MISCGYCEEQLSSEEETAYYQGKIYHPECIGKLLEEMKEDAK